VADVLRLSFAHDHFQAIAQGDQPTLAGDHAYLTNLPDIHKRVAMDSAKGRILQPLFDCFQVLRRQESLLGRDDPSDVPLRLEYKDFLGAEQEVLVAELAPPPCECAAARLSALP